MDFLTIESQLQQSYKDLGLLREQLTAFFTAVPDPIFIIDPNGNYLKVLGGNARHIYEDGTYLEGKNISDVFHNSLVNVFMNAITEVLESKELKVFEYQITTEDLLEKNTEVNKWYQGRIMLINDPEAKLSAVLWLSIDITERKALEKELVKLSNKDPLTGLYNRRFFNEEIQKQYSAYKRNKTPFTIALIDIDFFKQVNDNYGHDIGDEVLVTMSNLVMSEIRVNDLFARFGGEEFILMMPGTEHNSALELLERLREKIKSVIINTDKAELKITVSIGLSEIEPSDSKYEQIIKRADQSLYKAKDNGRDQVVFTLSQA